VRVGILGVGSIGKRHLANLIALGGHDLLVYDTDSAEMAHTSGTYDVGLAPRLEDVWNWKPDCALICTPPENHIDLALQVVMHNCHLFIEKPLADKMTPGLSRLNWMLKESNLISLVGCNMRFHAGPATIKRWLDEGAIGDVLSARFYCGSDLRQWHPDVDYRQSYSARTGAVLDVGSHEVDLATWLLGPARLRAAVAKPATSIGLECDGLAELLLEHDSGAVSSVHVSFTESIAHRNIGIIGTKGAASWAREEEYNIAHLELPGQPVADSILYLNDDAMYVRELEHFLRCVETGEQTVNPIGAACQTLALLLEAKR
jgi:predicted dehydrogenase